MSYAIELEGVSIIRKGHAVLDNISLGLEEGRCTVIMGTSGSGTSSLLKAAAGIIRPDKGRVLAWDQDIDLMSAQQQFIFREKMGFVFQDSALWANMTGFQNIALPFQFHRRRMSQEEIAASIAALAREFDFQTSLEYRPADYSTGEEKIISYMRAMILKPRILFLDDPTGSIDNIFEKRVLDILIKRQEEGCMLIINTHNSAYTLRLADNLIVMKAGRILEQGPVSQVRASGNAYVQGVLSGALISPGNP
ncbi:MAG: ATP-binding cassette domain-containing protein [Spirochaetales bacterium]|jgi:phospholipid/cholesterol/gamma-HCH transport system ATP-binding protein|nr:ATP-binding cassette domain-containing protein [Spirochaetales bacterium]